MSHRVTFNSYPYFRVASLELELYNEQVLCILKLVPSLYRANIIDMTGCVEKEGSYFAWADALKIFSTKGEKNPKALHM